MRKPKLENFKFDERKSDLKRNKKPQLQVALSH